MAEKTVEPVREEKSVLYEVGRGLGLFVFHTLMPVKIVHKERLQAEPPFVLIANHQHALDPIPMAMAIPGHQVVFLGKKELGKNRLIRNLLLRCHCILVDRHNADMAAMRNCMKAVKMKKILLIFPEGTRHHRGQMEEIENGASLIAMRTRAPIIPIYFDRKLSLFRVTWMVVGEPIPYDDLLERGINAETCEEMNERFRETFRRLIRETEELKSRGTKKN